MLQFNEWLKQIRDDEHIDLNAVLKLNKDLRAKNLINERNIEDLVETSNKLQESLDVFAVENKFLRYSFLYTLYLPINVKVDLKRSHFSLSGAKMFLRNV